MGGGSTRERGRPAACTPVACPSVSLRYGARPPCRRERHGPGRSRVPAPLPVVPGGGVGRGCARTCAGGTPALPGGFHPVTASRQWRSIGLRAFSWFVVKNELQHLPRMICRPGRCWTCGPPTSSARVRWETSGFVRKYHSPRQSPRRRREENHSRSGQEVCF